MPASRQRPDEGSDSHPFLDKLAHLRDPQVRRARWRRWLAQAPPAQLEATLRSLIDRCLLGSDRLDEALLSWVACWLDARHSTTAQARLERLYTWLHRPGAVSPPPVDFDPLRYLILDLAPARPFVATPKAGRQVSDDELTLGAKKTQASGYNRRALERLLLDPDPEVVARLCQNPRVRLADILNIVTRRPVAPSVLLAVAESDWIFSPDVRHALILNPYNSTGLVLNLLPLLRQPELDAMRFRGGGLHPLVQRCTQWLSERRAVLTSSAASD